MGESRRLSLALLGLAAITVCGAAPGAGAPAATAGKRARTEAQLAALKAKIAEVRNTVSRDAIESDRLTRELHAAEVSAGQARDQLDSLRQQQAEHSVRRAALAADRKLAGQKLAGEREELAVQMRLAWQLGGQEPLKLLLNQEDPARAGRMFAYYGYFGRARAAALAGIQADLKHMQDLDAQLDAEQQQLAALTDQRGQELARLDAARSQRSAALVSIKAESRDSQQVLQRLLAEQTALNDLLHQLAQAQEKFPVDSTAAFAQLRGRLTWPVSGHLAARFGETRAGGLKWDGLLIDTERGADVRAVYRGRVIYADWLPGLGQLAIIDHGSGWLSLYGHNDRLFKSVGETVQAGDVIASSGDSGGGSRPQLYFGIRKGSRAQDPGPWFSAARPPQ